MSGNSLKPNIGLIEIRKLLDDVIVFMRWQAEGTSLLVALEPVPDIIPTDILADLKWLREDLMCIAANALKFSRERFLVPVIIRLTIDTDENNNDEQMLCFSFIDSGRNLSNDRLLTLFDHPMTLSNERLGMGGRGLGLYCLRERVTAMGGRYGAKTRRDGLEGTEVWFCIPLLHADFNTKTFELPNPSHPVVQDTDKQPNSQLQNVGKNTAALEIPSTFSNKPKTSDFVMVLGGSRRLSTSNTRDGLFVNNKTIPLNRSTSSGMSNKGSKRSVTSTLHRGAYNALVSHKHKTKQPSIKSSIGSVHKSTDISPVETRRSSRDHGVLRSTTSSQPPESSTERQPSLEPSNKLSIESIRDSTFESPDDSHRPSVGACNLLLSTKINPHQQQPSLLKSPMASARKSIDVSPVGTRRSSHDHGVVLPSTESQPPPQLSNRSPSLSARKSTDISPVNTRRSSRDHGNNTVKITPQQPMRLSSKSSIESVRKSTDTSPILSPRISDDDHLRLESQKSLDRSSMDATPTPLASIKPPLDQVDEDLGLGALPILLVDDSITILKMIKRSILNELPDLVIKEARDGHEAFDRVQEETNGFHVIITDIQMPECNGFDFTLRVREYESKNRLSPTMIVGMSANYQEKFIMESQVCGMDGFIHKPFQLQTLLDVINHVQFHREITKHLDDVLHQESSSQRPKVFPFDILSLLHS